MPLARTLAAFLAIVAMFLTAIGAALISASEVDQRVSDITDNAAPSIEQLTSARADAQRLQFHLTEALGLGDGQRVRATAAAESDLAALKRDLTLYTGIPTFPGEEQLWAIIEKDVKELVSLAVSAIAALREPASEAPESLIRGQFATALNRATEDFMASIHLNATDAHRAAQAIETNRRHTSHLVLALTTIALVVSACVAAATARLLRTFVYLQIENERMAKDRAAELELFAARVAHDLRSPLSAASVTLEMLSRKGTPTGNVPHLVERGQSSLHRAVLMLDGLYAFARAIGSGPPGGSSVLLDAVQQTADEMRARADAAGLTIVVEPVPHHVAVRAAPGVLASILSNLLGNAVKYCPPGSRVTVRVVVEHLARIEVADNGPGIDPAVQETIFEPFVRATSGGAEGMGLGLATVKRLVEAHGGSCGVGPTPGGGSTFWLELPLA